MAATERTRIADQIVDIQADGRVVRADDGARARADDDVHRDPVADERAQHADVRGPAQATRAQHDANSNASRRLFHEGSGPADLGGPGSAPA